MFDLGECKETIEAEEDETYTKMMKVLSLQYLYGFSVGERTDAISIVRLAIGFCDKSAICATSSNEQMAGKHIPSRMVRG